MEVPHHDHACPRRGGRRHRRAAGRRRVLRASPAVGRRSAGPGRRQTPTPSPHPTPTPSPARVAAIAAHRQPSPVGPRRRRRRHEMPTVATDAERRGITSDRHGRMHRDLRRPMTAAHRVSATRDGCQPSRLDSRGPDRTELARSRSSMRIALPDDDLADAVVSSASRRRRWLEHPRLPTTSRLDVDRSPPTDAVAESVAVVADGKHRLQPAHVGGPYAGLRVVVQCDHRS